MKIKTISTGLLLSCVMFDSTAHAFTLEDRVSIRLNPFGLIGASFAGDVPININEYLAIGPMFLYQNSEILNTASKARGYGVRVDYHFTNVSKDGGYVSWQSYFTDLESQITQTGKTYTLADEGWSSVAVLGYLWRWEHITFNMGIGVGLSQLSETEFVASDGEVLQQPIKIPKLPVAIGGDFSLGWAF